MKTFDSNFRYISTSMKGKRFIPWGKLLEPQEARRFLRRHLGTLTYLDMYLGQVHKLICPRNVIKSAGSWIGINRRNTVMTPRDRP